ncbi:LysR family transcriptional regulator [Stackebrandtia nassauensis]|uniref:Transcriptional regulator, LysR family n=1 Tax=Stackebrandtia nassauensis (strain DSM 44728 / CIP 108903 / NRRL B-16338 / NBRC 102104 / LLR-40K-21) TaxID=446470 RepID=D3QB06_STANL|nr:LysR family transcriptional regulator [Stackebrandtia nassauensis]ADD40823.1 transcriptional regulator, LysR family [Stackebrandtia nassauensis DSM 44728]
MELLALRYFQTVARTENISRAAERLRIAQPSLSRTIARLESELKVPLFDRRGRNISLNRFGVAFLHRVDKALAELDDARRELTESAGLERGGFAIASETLLTVTDTMSEFLTEYPDVEVRLYQATGDEMRQLLQSRQVDMCLASQQLTDPSFTGVEVIREEVLLAVPPHHRLANQTRVTLADIADEPFITTRPGYWLRTLLDRLFADAGLRPVIRCEGDEPGVIQTMISTGLGIGLNPSQARYSDIRTDVAWLHLDAPDCHRVLRLYWNTDAFVSQAARRFRDFTIERLRQQLSTPPALAVARTRRRPWHC